MKTTLYIFVLFTFSLNCVAQIEQVQQDLENSYPIRTSQVFKQLRPAIAKLAPPKKDGFFWSSKLLITLESAKDWAESSGTSQDKLLASYYLLMYHDNHIEEDSIISIGKKLLTDPQFIDMPESVLALSALSSSYRRKGYYRQQLDILNSLIQQNARFNYNVRPSTYGYYNELALVYYNLGQYTLARTNFEKQAVIFRNANDFFRTSSMLNNIALTYDKQQKTDSAINFYNQSLYILENNTIQDDYYTKDYVQHFENVVSVNMVKNKMAKGKVPNAKKILQDLLASSKSVKELSTLADAYQDLTNYYYQNKQFDLAQIYNDSTLSFEKTFQNPNNREKAYLLRAKIALGQNRNKNVLQYFDLSVALRDSITAANEEKNFSEATAKYDFIKTGEALTKNKKLLQQREDANRIQLFFLCVVALLSLIIGGMLLKSKKANKLIANQKKALEKGLKEKEIMLNEIHHRIKNNLQVVSGILELQRAKIDSPEHAKIYEESQDYLQSMSMIHELLYEQEGVTTLDMHDYLNKLGHLLIGNYPNCTINYNVSATTVHLDVSKATPLALIICELISNSLKHAFSKTGSITIDLIKNEQKYVLNYSDNGFGFDNVNNPEYYNTGLNLIILLAEDLDGQVEFFNDNGFHCTLKFDD